MSVPRHPMLKPMRTGDRVPARLRRCDGESSHDCRRFAALVAVCLVPMQRLHHAHPGRRRRAIRSPCSASPSCSACAARSISRKRRSSASAPMPSGSAPSDLHLNFWVALLMGMGVALVMGAFLGMTTLASRWPLPGDGDDQLPADRHPGHGELDSGDAWPGWRRQYSAPSHCSSRSTPSSALCVAAMAIVGYIVWRLPQTAARALHARRARQRTRRRRRRRQRLSRQSRRLRDYQPCSAASAAAFSPAASPTSAPTSSASPNRSSSSP